MAETEELLKKLIALQQEEMARNRLARQLHFFFGTLPMLIIVVLTIVGSWMLYEATVSALSQAPDFMTGQLEQYLQ